MTTIDAHSGNAPLSEAGEQRLAQRKTGHGQLGTAAFEGKRTPKRLEQLQRLLETLAALGQAEEVRPGVWGRV